LVDITAALTPDTEGIGSGTDVTTPLPIDIAAPAHVRGRINSPAHLP
jgi:hypothetical protein